MYQNGGRLNRNGCCPTQIDQRVISRTDSTKIQSEHHRTNRKAKLVFVRTSTKHPTGNKPKRTTVRHASPYNDDNIYSVEVIS